MALPSGLDGQLLHRPEHSGQQGVGLLVGGLRQHQQELVGAVAADQVAAAQLGRERRRPMAQHLVPRLAASALVDGVKSSRSIMTKATCRPCRSARASSNAARSRRLRKLSSPVSGSWVSCSRRSCSRRRLSRATSAWSASCVRSRRCSSGMKSVLVVQVAGRLLSRRTPRTGTRCRRGPAHSLLGEDLSAGDPLEDAVDDAALNIADGRAGSRKVFAAQAAAEFDEHALLVEFHLEVAELHPREPVLEALDGRDAEVAAGALAREVDGRAGALAEDLGKDRELQQTDERRRRRGVGRRGRQHFAGVGPHPALLGSRQCDDAAERTRKHGRQRHLFLGTHSHSHPLSGRARATHSRRPPSRRAARMPAGRLCLYYRRRRRGPVQ